ncbi:hypothetical protein Tco_0882344 [Tanacetum coccineum]
MTDMETKSTMKEFATNGQENYYSGITSITVNGKNAYELKGKFIDDLHKNAFDGTNGEDVVKYIEYFLKIVDPIDFVNQDKLRVVVFQSHYDEDETAKIFRIEINMFDYEAPLCEEFKEFNYLLKIDPDLLTKDIEGFKTYKDYKDDWIYEWNKDIPWVHEKPWVDNGVWEEPKPVKHCWRSRYDCKDSNHEEREYMDEHDVNDKELFDNATQERAVCLIKRYVMIKYSFWDDKKYVAIREDEYNDLTIRNKEACQAYQEIFRMMDNRWTVTRTE